MVDYSILYNFYTNKFLHKWSPKSLLISSVTNWQSLFSVFMSLDEVRIRQDSS